MKVIEWFEPIDLLFVLILIQLATRPHSSV